MNINVNKVKIFVTIPPENVEKVYVKQGQV